MRSTLSFPEYPSNFDVMQTEVKFPVVESAPLVPIPNRVFRQTRRDPRHLPALVGGSVHVFQTNDRYALAPPGPKMLTSDVVVKATMVVVVLTRSQLVPAVATLPSIDPTRRLGLRASYNCQVIDPVRVLEGGCWDVRTALLEYLLSDTQMRMLGAREDVASNPEVSQRILARTLARNELEPPRIPGMRTRLVDVTLAIHNDGEWMPEQRRTIDDDVDEDFRRRDRYDNGNDDNGRPRDGYGSYEPDGEE